MHRDLFMMLQAARELFPDTPMDCYTNGLLLKRLTDEQLALLMRLKVRLVITEYPPIKNSIQSFYEKVDKVGLRYHVILTENQKFFSKRQFDFEKSTPKHLYAGCLRFTACSSVFLYKGLLYKCPCCILADDFNAAFNTNLKLEDGDFLKLGYANQEEILNFLITRKPFCGYCKPMTERLPWALSQRTIDEWT